MLMALVRRAARIDRVAPGAATVGAGVVGGGEDG